MKIRLTVLALALVALAFTTSTTAQGGSGYPILAHVDVPSDGDTISSAPIFGGWAGNCETGRHVGAITLYRRAIGVPTGEFVTASVYWGPRPDVQAYFNAVGCNDAEIALGFSVVPHSAQPSGQWEYSLLFTDAPFSQSAALVTRTVTVQ